MKRLFLYTFLFTFNSFLFSQDIVCTDLPASDNTFYVSSDGTVYYNATSPIAGFQFTLVGSTIDSASGGIAEQLGISISTSNYNAVGFSLSNTEIQPGSGILTQLSGLSGIPTGLTGIVMTKLDCTAKGGNMIALAKRYAIPIIAPSSVIYVIKSLSSFNLSILCIS